MLHNSHTKMTVSTFNPKVTSALSSQTLPEGHPGANIPLNGAGIITIINIKNSGKKLVLASGKLNPQHGNFENSLALGGGFKFLNGGIEGNTFTTAINASIQFKAPTYPSLEEGQIAPVALVGYCKEWGDMQYATLHRFIDVETIDEAITLVKKINENNKTLGKPDSFGLYPLDDVLKSAKLTHQLSENNKAKGDAIQTAGLIITDLVSGENRERFVIFDDLATAALKKLILQPALTAKTTDNLGISASALNSGQVGTAFASSPRQVKQEEVKAMSTPTASML